MLGVVYRSLTWHQLWNLLVKTAVVSGMVLLLVGAARLLSWVFAVQQIPQQISEAALGLGGGATAFLLLTIAVFLPLGAILEGVPAVVMLTPVLLPVARQLGISNAGDLGVFAAGRRKSSRRLLGCERDARPCQPATTPLPGLDVGAHHRHRARSGDCAFLAATHGLLRI